MRPGTWPAALLLVTLGWTLVLTCSGCCLAPAPTPATRDHRLDRLGLVLTLPGSHRGGDIGGIYVFQSPSSDQVLSIDDGPARIETSEAGVRTFLDERANVSTEWSRPMRIGAYDGFAGAGLERGSTTRRVYNGLFDGPRGAVRVQLITTALDPAMSDAAWESTCATIRAL